MPRIPDPLQLRSPHPHHFYPVQDVRERSEGRTSEMGQSQAQTPPKVQAEAEVTSSQQAPHAGPETSEMSSVNPNMQVQAEEEEVAAAFERAWLAASGQGVDMRKQTPESQTQPEAEVVTLLRERVLLLRATITKMERELEAAHKRIHELTEVKTAVRVYLENTEQTHLRSQRQRCTPGLSRPRSV